MKTLVLEKPRPERVYGFVTKLEKETKEPFRWAWSM